MTKYIVYRESEDPPHTLKDQIAVPLPDADFMFIKAIEKLTIAIQKASRKL